MTFKTMRERAEENEAIAKRLDLYEHGAYEQFYDYEHDPDALVNLIDDPKFQSLIDEHREAMRNLMVQSNDPLLAVFDRRDDREFVSGVIDGLQAESDVRAKASRKSKQENQRRQNPRLFKISVPDKVVVGEGLKVTVDHRIPKAMGTQPFFATVKDQAGKRIERREKSASGVGAFTFEFAVDESQAGKNVKIAVFIGPSYQETLLHRTAGPVNVVAGSP